MKIQKRIKYLLTEIINNNNQILYKIINFIILLIILITIIFLKPPTEMLKKVGDRLKKTYVSKTEIRYLDKEATKRNEEIIKLTTPPVFIYNKDNIKLLYKAITILVGDYLCGVSAW